MRLDLLNLKKVKKTALRKSSLLINLIMNQIPIKGSCSGFK